MSKPTKVVCLWGGPGSGKSTTAAALFAMLKQKGVSCELVREYVKDWAWRQRKIDPLDQWYFLGKQLHKESSLYGKVDVLVTDSPWMIQPFYSNYYGKNAYILTAARQIWPHIREVHPTVSAVHYFVRRTKPYDTGGRYETEEQACALDEAIKTYMVAQGIKFETLTTDEILQLEGNK